MIDITPCTELCELLRGIMVYESAPCRPVPPTSALEVLFVQGYLTRSSWPVRPTLPEPSAVEEGILARGNNNAQQAVWDHRRSAEDSSVHHHYWSPSVVTGERKEEENTMLRTQDSNHRDIHAW